MIFKVKNLGKIKEAEVDLNKDLILLTGQNNTGKTYLAYAIYGFLRNNRPEGVDYHYSIHEKDEKISGEVKIDLDKYISSEQFTEQYLKLRTDIPLNDLFRANHNLGTDQISKPEIDYYIHKEDELSEFKRKIYESEINKHQVQNITFQKKAYSYNLTITIDKDKSKSLKAVEVYTNIIIRLYSYPPNITFFPVERSAINIFSKELSLKQNETFDNILTKPENEQLKELRIYRQKINRYPKPIRVMLKFSNDLLNLSKRKSYFFYLADELENNILGGKISVSEYGDLRFKPENSEISPLETHLTGSMIKSLAGISFYLRHIAQKHDCIIIDEPEINLHPDNQRKIARFFGRLINEGFKVIISTHSDYIIKEINNLVMLSKESETQKELLKKYNYAENELIKPERIEALLFRKSNDNEQITPEKIEVDAQGLSVDTIDEELDKLNNVAENIYFQLFENQ